MAEGTYGWGKQEVSVGPKGKWACPSVCSNSN